MPNRQSKKSNKKGVNPSSPGAGESSSKGVNPPSPEAKGKGVNPSTPEPEESSSKDVNSSDQNGLILAMMEAMKNPAIIKKFGELISSKFDAVCDKISSSVVKKLTDQIQSLTKENENLKIRVQQLEKKADDLEQYSRRNSLRVSGLQYNENSDDPESLIMDLVNEKLKLNPPLEDSEVDRCHRVGKKKDIIIKFTSYKARSAVIGLRSELRDLRNESISTSGIYSTVYINEDLTQVKAKLAYQARVAKKAKSITDTWTYDGRVVIKDNNGTIKEITNENDLPEIRN